MGLVFEGIMLGLSLAVLVGPIFVALTQTGVHRGISAGLWVGAGIWISDFLVILTCWYFVLEVQDFIQQGNNALMIGVVGGLILIATGIAALLNKHEHDMETPELTARNGMGYFVKGFAVNFINPFTFVFWTGITGHYAGVRQIAWMDALVFFSSIMLTIIFTDSLKVLLAAWIRNRLKRSHLVLLGRISGTVLVVFGIILIIRSGNWFTGQ